MTSASCTQGRVCRETWGWAARRQAASEGQPGPRRMPLQARTSAQRRGLAAAVAPFLLRGTLWPMLPLTSAHLRAVK